MSFGISFWIVKLAKLLNWCLGFLKFDVLDFSKDWIGVFMKDFEVKNFLNENWDKTLNTNSFAFHFTDSFTGCDGASSDWYYCCSSSNPCGVAEGHCSNDEECQGHLLCGTGNCFSPFPSYADCCYDPFPSKQKISKKFEKSYI